MTGFYDGSGNPMFDSPDIEFENEKPADLANAVVLATTLPYGCLPLENPAATEAVGEAGVDGRVWVIPDDAETVSTAHLATMIRMVQEGDTVIISGAAEDTVWSIRDVLEGISSDEEGAESLT